MKHQVIVIHGGDVYDTYKEYLSNLKKEKVEGSDLVRYEGWKNRLEKTLGKGFQVIAPRMPNPDNARYLEWKIWFEKFIPHVKKEAVFVGHSLGGIFLARYFAENEISKKVRGILLVAAPFNLKGSARSLADFVLPDSLRRLREYGGLVHLYFSTDDKVVSFKNFRQYARFLPQSEKYVFKDRGHFRQEKFPELVKDIKNLYR